MSGQSYSEKADRLLPAKSAYDIVYDYMPSSFAKAEKRIQTELQNHKSFTTTFKGIALKKIILVDSVDQHRLERLRSILLPEMTHYEKDIPKDSTFFMLSRFMEDGKKGYDQAFNELLIQLKSFSQVQSRRHFAVVFVPTRDRRDVLRILKLCDDRIHVPTFEEEDICAVMELMRKALLECGCNENGIQITLEKDNIQGQKDVAEFYKGCTLEEIFEHISKAFVDCTVHRVFPLSVDILLQYGAIHEGSKRYSYSAFETEKNLDFYEPHIEPNWDGFKRDPSENEVVEEPEEEEQGSLLSLPPKKKRKISPH